MQKKKQQVVVSMFWKGTLLSVECLQGDGCLYIGNGKKVNFFIFDRSLPARFAFIEKKSHGFVLNVPLWMEAYANEIRINQSSYDLKLNESVEAKAGPVEFKIKLLNTDSACASTGMPNRVDRTYLQIFLGLCALQVAFMVWVFQKPSLRPSPENLRAESDTFHEVVIKDRIQLPKMKIAPDMKEARQPEKLSQEQKVAQIFKQIGLTKTGPATKILNAAVHQSLANLREQEVGTMSKQGIKSQSKGQVGGGSLVGIGKTGFQTGVGAGTFGAFNGKDKANARIEAGNVTYEGSLTREEIQRVVDRFLSQIRYCYEREFQKSPDLAGKILANWIIAAEGYVDSSSVKHNTMGNVRVEQCVLRVINRMVFPKPRGGGIVKVNYPFVFSSAGA